MRRSLLRSPEFSSIFPVLLNIPPGASVAPSPTVIVPAFTPAPVP
jgi:hypothetical protein